MKWLKWDREVLQHLQLQYVQDLVERCLPFAGDLCGSCELVKSGMPCVRFCVLEIGVGRTVLYSDINITTYSSSFLHTPATVDTICCQFMSIPDQIHAVVHLNLQLSSLQSLIVNYPLVNKHSYWKCPFIVDLPIKNGDFPSFFINYHSFRLQFFQVSTCLVGTGNDRVGLCREAGLQAWEKWWHVVAWGWRATILIKNFKKPIEELGSYFFLVAGVFASHTDPIDLILTGTVGRSAAKLSQLGKPEKQILDTFRYIYNYVFNSIYMYTCVYI